MKFAVILSGCGQHDGSEIHEVILTLLSMDQEGIKYDAFAPNIDQSNVINHLKSTSAKDEIRNVLVESARLVRGNISPLEKMDPLNYDALILPGGFGAVSNLSTWSYEGINFKILDILFEKLNEAKELKKPMGFICIAPILITKIFENAKLTIGNDKEIAKQIHLLGCNHINCSATNVVIDEVNKVISTPANMVAENITDVYKGIKKLIKELKKWL